MQISERDVQAHFIRQTEWDFEIINSAAPRAAKEARQLLSVLYGFETALRTAVACREPVFVRLTKSTPVSNKKCSEAMTTVTRNLTYGIAAAIVRRPQYNSNTYCVVLACIARLTSLLVVN